MSRLIDAIRSWLPRRASTRSVAGSETWFQTPTLSGVTVTEDTVPTFAAAYAAINVLSSDVAAIPLNVVKQDANNTRLVDHTNRLQELVSHCPNRELTALGMRQAMLWHCLTVGNSFAEIQRDAMLRPTALHLLDPDKVQVCRTSDESLYYDVEGEKFLPADIIHIAAPGRDGLIGRSPIRQCREAFGLGMGVEKFGASYFGNGISPSGFISVPETMDEDATRAFRAGVNREHQGPYNANKLLILQGGQTFTPTSISAEDAQFLATRKFQVNEVCRIFRIPPTKLMDFDRASFSNIEETNLDYYLSSLMPWLRRFEVEYNRKLLTKQERQYLSIEHDEAFTLRGRIVDQANVEKIYRDMGVYSTDEIRGRHGLGRVPGGDARYIPLNMARLDAAPVPTPTPTESAPTPGVPPAVPTEAADVQATALNGAQIASLLSIAQQVAAGALPAGSAKGMIAASFPSLTEPQIDAILSSLDGFTPAAEGTDPAPDEAARDAVRAVVLDVARRMVKREANAIRTASRKRDHAALVTALDAHYQGEAGLLAEAYGPALGAYRAVCGGAPAPSPFAGSIVERSMAEVRACVEGQDTAAALSALADRWEAEKPDHIVSTLAAR